MQECPPLLDVRDMPSVPGLRVPAQFYIVAVEPVPIAGMAWPHSTPWPEIGKLGFRHVICLAAKQPKYDPSPLTFACSVELQDLVSGHAPTDPAGEERLIRNAVDIATDRIHAREGIVVHCLGGTGRTGTVLGCLLAELGCDPTVVIDYLDRTNKQRGRRGWPEAPWQAELVLQFHK
jgi:hypothetical protein